ncbi:MAG: hypothetical protein EA378_09900 [Phycisphaerales bacterium]|nr:MAG: hypothetical protein EA378_09900 [Phycisphaerales bacterium]
MALIKRADLDRLTREARVMDLGDMERRGEMLREAAREEASKILAEARAERERLIEGARTDGFEAGRAAGRAEGLAQGKELGRAEAVRAHGEALERLIQNWESALSAFEVERDAMLLSARQDVLELALVLAERVTKRTVEVDRGVASAQLEAVLRQVVKPTALEIAVHPADMTLASQALSRLTRELEAASHASLVTDEHMERGSCVARCVGGGRIDATIRTQLERAVEAAMPGARELLSPPREDSPELLASEDDADRRESDAGDADKRQSNGGDASRGAAA